MEARSNRVTRQNGSQSVLAYWTNYTRRRSIITTLFLHLTFARNVIPEAALGNAAPNPVDGVAEDSDVSNAVVRDNALRFFT